MPLVTDWVSPSTSYVIAAVFTMVKENPVTYVVMLPYFREDEAVLREPPENLGRSSLAEKHMRIVLATEGREGPHSHDKAECPSVSLRQLVTYSIQFTQHPVGLGTALEEIRCGTSPAVCSRLSATLVHPGILSSSVPKSLHLQRRELPYLPSAGRVPKCLVATVLPFIYDFYLQHWIRFHVDRTETSRTLLCRVHRHLLNAFIVRLMGHTAVQTSVEQGFLAAEATLFHVLMPIETSRPRETSNGSPMRHSTFVHDLMTLQAPEAQSVSLSDRPATVIEMSCFFKDQLDSVRCSPSLPRYTDALSRVNSTAIELYCALECVVAGSPTLEESYLSKTEGRRPKNRPSEER